MEVVLLGPDVLVPRDIFLSLGQNRVLETSRATKRGENWVERRLRVKERRGVGWLGCKGGISGISEQSRRGNRWGEWEKTGVKSGSARRMRVMDTRRVEVVAGEESSVEGRVGKLVKRVHEVEEGVERMRFLVEEGRRMTRMDGALKTRENQIMGCMSRVWINAHLASDGRLLVEAESDSELTRGVCALLVNIFDGLDPADILRSDVEDLTPLSSFLRRSSGKAKKAAVSSAAQSLESMFLALKKRVMRLTCAGIESDSLPSLVISRGGNIAAAGEFALAQAKFLSPDAARVSALVAAFREKKLGVVAHFYMDPEVQGVLVAAQKEWPHIHISDSLVMADSALKMVEAGGCEAIAVLGVDFMAENVRAVLDRGGYSHVRVVRMASEEIGCSLAAAAQSDAYLDYLREAAKTPNSLHVIYINTSLDTKAHAHALVPTITCTSSNVVQTVLQAFSQVPDLTLWYGPDTYMGGNLAEMLRQVAVMSDEEISAVHPGHDQRSISAILPRLKYFQDGACMVHDMFGEAVVGTLRESYGDAFLTAHFEVPGEMFLLAMDARRRGRGVVGSTQNILDFIRLRTRDAVERGFDDRLQFVLGTETGMVTAIVQVVLAELAGAEADVAVEIVFPVDGSAISRTGNGVEDGRPASIEDASPLGVIASLPVVPGVASGEGCSASGGCASCPYMKMNSLDALERVCALIGTPGEAFLAAHEPKKFEETLEGQKTVADVGYAPIFHMRQFQKSGKLSDELVEDILIRNRSL